MTDMTYLHNFVFISVAIALNGCIIYVQDLIFNMNPTVMSRPTYFGNFDN